MKFTSLPKLSQVLILLVLIPLMTMCSSPEKSSSDTANFPDPGPPDSIPAPFAPGLVATGMFTRDMAITPDGREMYFSIAAPDYSYATILYSQKQNGKWSSPEIVPFSGGAGITDLEPALSADGSQLYFLSTRPDGDEAPGDQDIWMVEREGEGWSEPLNLGAPVNTEGGEFFPSLTSDGSLYFTRAAKGSRLNQIFRSRYRDGGFSEPELLPEEINCGSNRFNAFIARDESYIIIPAMGLEDVFDGVDYYISFRTEDDRWSKPLNMGAAVNKGNARGWSPYVSSDKSTFFFMSTYSDSIPEENWNYQYLKTLHNRPGNGLASTFFMDAAFISKLKERAVFD